jgi:hypothetical protein
MPEQIDQAEPNDAERTAAENLDVLGQLVSVRQRFRSILPDLAESLRNGNFKEGSYDAAGYARAFILELARVSSENPETADRPWNMAINIAEDLVQAGHADAAIILLDGVLDIPVDEENDERRSGVARLRLRLVTLEKLIPVEEALAEGRWKKAKTLLKEVLEETDDEENRSDLRRIEANIRSMSVADARARRIGVAIVGILLLILGVIQMRPWADSAPPERKSQPIPAAVMDFGTAPARGTAGNVELPAATWCAGRGRALELAIAMGKTDPTLRSRLRAEVDDYAARCGKISPSKEILDEAGVRIAKRDFSAEAAAMIDTWRRDAGRR